MAAREGVRGMRLGGLGAGWAALREPPLSPMRHYSLTSGMAQLIAALILGYKGYDPNRSVSRAHRPKSDAATSTKHAACQGAYAAVGSW